MTRTRAAKKATQAPAKTAAKRTTPAKPRTPRKTTTPALSLVKDDAKPDPAEATTQVDHRDPLPVRRRLFVGPMGASEQAAVRAALAAAAARLPIPVRTWNGSSAALADGTLLIHNPGPDRHFTAHIACRHGAIHGWPIHTLRDLGEARALTHACERRHSSTAEDKAITHGVGPVPAPKPPAIHFLREGVRRATAAKAETQPLTADAIAEGIAARTPDTETAKEHPQP